jgi:hypothetical protein
MDVDASLPRGGESSGNTAADSTAIDPAKLAKRMLSTKVENWGAYDEALQHTHPTLWGFLFRKSWNGYDPRECGVLSISIRPTGVTASVKLPSEAWQVTVLSTYIGEVFDLLDHALRTRSGDWKELKNGPGAQKLREERKKLRETRKQKK